MMKNIKIINTDEIPYSYNLLNLTADKDQNPDDISENLKKSGISPYIYVRQSLKLLVEGEYNKSFRLIQYAGKIGSLFYSPGSNQNENFRQTVNLMQYIIIHLTDEFKDL
jgi:hypothetical protein